MIGVAVVRQCGVLVCCSGVMVAELLWRCGVSEWRVSVARQYPRRVVGKVAPIH